MSGGGEVALPVACPQCAAEIGRMVQVDGRVHPDDGRFMIVVGFTYCHCCGKRFSFSPPKVEWEVLVSRRYQRVPVLSNE